MVISSSRGLLRRLGLDCLRLDQQARNDMNLVYLFNVLYYHAMGCQILPEFLLHHRFVIGPVAIRVIARAFFAKQSPLSRRLLLEDSQRHGCNLSFHRSIFHAMRL